jgi:hypothetical protein
MISACKSSIREATSKDPKIEDLEEKLARLEPWKQIAFMAMTLERMWPNFQRFSKETGFGDPSVPRAVLDTAWLWLAPGNHPENLDSLLSACQEQAPNTENFRSPLTSAALDAANAAEALVEALMDPESPQPMEVAALARETVDLWVQEGLKLDPNAPRFEEAVSDHALMRGEIGRQHEDSKILAEWTGTREGLVRELRARCADATPLDRSEGSPSTSSKARSANPPNRL